jgi:hypothetical protein
MGTLLRIDPPVCQRTEIGDADPRGGPHGASDRLRIDVLFRFPESQFRTHGGSVIQGGTVAERIILINTSARRPAARGARGHSVLNRHKVRMTEAFPITAWVKDITGHRYRWD